MNSISNLRLEASEFYWDELTIKQQDAIEKVATMLNKAISDLDSERIKSSRRSQLAFVDGDRGTGKTSVLLTIKKMLDGDSTNRVNYVTDQRPVNKLIQNEKRIVWLENLDMEPIRRDSNLFAAILSRLENVLSENKSRRSNLATAIEHLDPDNLFFELLGSLQNDIVLALDGATRKRAENLDPHAYAAEVLRAEKASLGLNKKLTNVLESLVELYDDPGKKTNPLFVLPIDDFDLAPTRCLELLRLIRTVSTPRLFFLIVGCARIAEVALILQNEGELASLIEGSHHLDYEWKHYIRPTGMEVASNNLRKLLPPAQRATLTQVDLTEALLLNLDRENSHIYNALSKIYFSSNIQPSAKSETTLWDFILPDTPGFMASNKAHPVHSNYVAAEYLGGTPRQIHDLGMLLSSFEGKQDMFGLKLLTELSVALRRDINEDWRIPPDERSEITRALEFTFDNRLRLADTIKPISDVATTRQLDYKLPASHPRDFDPNSTDAPIEPDYKWTQFRDLEWVSRNTLSDKNRLIRYPLRASAGITLFHDLTMSMWGGYIINGSLVPPPAILPRIQYEDSSHKFIASTNYRLDKGSLTLPWPLPKWTTFRQFERFKKYWGQLISSESTEYDNLDVCWIESILRIVCEDALHSTVHSGGNWNKAVELVNDLVQEHNDFANNRQIRNELISSTLVTLGLTLCPEFRITSESSVKNLESRCSGFFEILASNDAIREEIRRLRGLAWRTIAEMRDHSANLTYVLAAISPGFTERREEAKGNAIPDFIRYFERHPINSNYSNWKLTPDSEHIGQPHVAAHV